MNMPQEHPLQTDSGRDTSNSMMTDKLPIEMISLAAFNAQRRGGAGFGLWLWACAAAKHAARELSAQLRAPLSIKPATHTPLPIDFDPALEITIACNDSAHAVRIILDADASRALLDAMQFSLPDNLRVAPCADLDAALLEFAALCGAHGIAQSFGQSLYPFHIRDIQNHSDLIQPFDAQDALPFTLVAGGHSGRIVVLCPALHAADIPPSEILCRVFACHHALPTSINVTLELPPLSISRSELNRYHIGSVLLIGSEAQLDRRGMLRICTSTGWEVAWATVETTSATAYDVRVGGLVTRPATETPEGDQSSLRVELATQSLPTDMLRQLSPGDSLSFRANSAMATLVDSLGRHSTCEIVRIGKELGLRLLSTSSAIAH